MKYIRKRAYRAQPNQVIHMEGLQFGYLTVLRRVGRKDRYITWLCRCACGTEVEVDGHKLRRGQKKACCLNGHRWRKEKPTGITVLYPGEYQSWHNMHDRCKNSRHKNFQNYGGRGIKVCAQWASFESFLRDMGRKPDPKFTIERNDINGQYEPGNCRWASRTDQTRNKRNSVFVTYQGKKLLLIDLISELGLSKTIVRSRLAHGWSLEQAIALPKMPRGNNGSPRKPYKKKPVAECISYAKGMHKEFLDSLKEKDPK